MINPRSDSVWDGLVKVVVFAFASVIAACGGGDSVKPSDTAAALSASTTLSQPLGAAQSSASDALRVLALTNRVKQHLSPTLTQYTFDAVVQNRGPNAKGVTFVLTAAGAGTTIVQGVISAGDLASNTTTKFPATVVLQQDSSNPFIPSSLVWDLRVERVVLSSISQPTGALITLAGVATVDLTGQTGLGAGPAGVSLVLDTAANELAISLPELETTFGDANAILITLPALPTAPVPMTITASSAVGTIGPNSALGLFALSSADDEDGSDLLIPLPGTLYDATAGTLGASISPHLFAAAADGTASLLLKVGVASVTAQPARATIASTGAREGPAGVRVATATTASASNLYTPGIVLPCPLAGGCTETSQFNKLRVLPPKDPSNPSYVRQHLGMDLSAKTSLALTMPAGGMPVHVFSREAYDDIHLGTNNTGFNKNCTSGYTVSPTKDPKTGAPIPGFKPVECVRPKDGYCKTAVGSVVTVAEGLTSCFKVNDEGRINSRAGVTLSAKVGSYYLRFMHLDRVQAAYQMATPDQDGNFAKTAERARAAGIEAAPPFTTDAVAMSGGTGAGAAPHPHLHVELYARNNPLCKPDQLSGGCLKGMSAEDPFPHMVAEFSLKADGLTTLPVNPDVRPQYGYTFSAAASDASGVVVRSEVKYKGGHALENNGVATPYGPLQPGFGYDPTRKLCLTVSVDRLLGWPGADNIDFFRNTANLSAGQQIDRSCVSWQTQPSNAATSNANAPSVDVSAQFTVDPTVAVQNDPLSGILTASLASNKVRLVAASTSFDAIANQTAQYLTVGTAMASFSPLAPLGGTADFAYSYSGGLPAGLSMSSSSGAVTGTPTTPYATANTVFSVQDKTGAVAPTTSTVSFTVSCVDASNTPWPPTGPNAKIRWKPCATLTRGGALVPVSGLVDIYYANTTDASVQLTDDGIISGGGEYFVAGNGNSWRGCLIGDLVCTGYPSWTSITVGVPANYVGNTVSPPLLFLMLQGGGWTGVAGTLRVVGP